MSINPDEHSFESNEPDSDSEYDAELERIARSVAGLNARLNAIDAAEDDAATFVAPSSLVVAPAPLPLPPAQQRPSRSILRASPVTEHRQPDKRVCALFAVLCALAGLPCALWSGIAFGVRWLFSGGCRPTSCFGWRSRCCCSRRDPSSDQLMGMTANDNFILRLWVVAVPIATIALTCWYNYAVTEQEEVIINRFRPIDKWFDFAVSSLGTEATQAAVEANAAAIGFPTRAVTMWSIPIGIFCGFWLPPWVRDRLILLFSFGGVAGVGTYAAILQDVRKVQMVIPVSSLTISWIIGMTCHALVVGALCCERVSDDESSSVSTARATLSASAPTANATKTQQFTGFPRLLLTGAKAMVDAAVSSAAPIDRAPLRSSMHRNDEGVEGQRRRGSRRRVSIDDTPHLVGENGYESSEGDTTAA